MGQRLGIASALPGDRHTLILDEPAKRTGEGVVWVRSLVRFLASEGRTVFLSLHAWSSWVRISAAFSRLLAWQGTERGAPASILVFSIAAGMASLAVAVLGTLVITGEYSTGMIRSTLAAVPRRLQALWAKGLVRAVSIFLVSTVGWHSCLPSCSCSWVRWDCHPTLSTVRCCAP